MTTTPPPEPVRTPDPDAAKAPDAGSAAAPEPVASQPAAPVRLAPADYPPPGGPAAGYPAAPPYQPVPGYAGGHHQSTPGYPGGAMPQPAAYPPYGYDPSGYGQFGAPPVRRHNGMGLTAMILGIISLATFWIPGVAVILGILAVVFGAIGLKRVDRSQATNRGQAFAGLILGVIGTVVTVVFWIWVYNTAKDCLDKYDRNSPAYEQCVRDKVNG